MTAAVMDRPALHAAIRERGLQFATLAIESGMPLASLQRKLTGRADFTVRELGDLCRAVDIKPSDLFPEPKPVKKSKSLTPRVRNSAVTEEMRVWAAANLDHLGERIVFDDRKTKTRQASDGLTYRRAFRITVAPGHSPTFAIHLYQGASQRDLRCARRIIEQAKAGNFQTGDWTRIEKFSNQEYGGYSMRLWFAVTGEPARDELRECKDTACVEQFHEWRFGEQDAACRTEAITHPTGAYTVSGWRFHGDQWAAYVEHDTECFPEGPEGLKIIRDLANDYAWVQAECDRFNAKEAAA